MKPKLPISVIVPVLNESKNLPDCLRSVAFADEVFVVDSHSTDDTIRVAEGMGAKTVQFDYVPGGPRKKSWAMANLPLRHEWLLLIDADERVTEELELELRELFLQGPTARGYYLNRQHIFLGRWLKHGGNYPSWNLRLLRRGAGRFERLGTETLASAGDVEVHEHVLLDGEAGYLHAPLRHEDFKDLQHFIDRHNRYSTWDASMRRILRDGKGSENIVESLAPRWSGSPVERKRFLKRLWIHLPAKPLLRFLYMYVFRLGFLDGRPGFLYACFKAIQEFHISAKMYEEGLKREQFSFPCRRPARIFEHNSVTMVADPRS
ncbi:MAG: glycosyltransferase family 2 protein [Planctomycetota bacterium]